MQPRQAGTRRFTQPSFRGELSSDDILGIQASWSKELSNESRQYLITDHPAELRQQARWVEDAADGESLKAF
jgi:hypothetical protein